MTRLLNETEITETLQRLAQSIAGTVGRDERLALIGIRRRGEPLGRRLLPLLEQAGRPATHFGVLDITLYRDDLTTIGQHAVVRGTDIDLTSPTCTWCSSMTCSTPGGRFVRHSMH